MPKLVKVVIQPNITRWLITPIDKTQSSAHDTGADATPYEGIPRDEFKRLLDEAMKKHAWLLNELAKR